MMKAIFFEYLGATILITLFHGFPAILMAYLFSFWAKTPASGFSVMTILGVISGKYRHFKIFHIFQIKSTRKHLNSY